MEFRFLQPLKIQSPIDVNLSDKVAELRLRQDWNAALPMDVTLLGIVIEDS